MAAVLAVFACGSPATETSDLTIDLRTLPATPLVGADARAHVRLIDATQRPVLGARIQIEAHMEHPGMAPVLTPAVEQPDGTYTGGLRFPMAGPWVLFIAGQLPDGARIRQRAGEIEVVAPPGG